MRFCTRSEKPLDPKLFDIGPKDSSPPVLNRIKLVRMLPDSTIVDFKEYHSNYIRKGKYSLPQDTLIVDAWRVGVEINGFDRMDGALNKNGIHQVKMYVNDQLAYAHRIDSFSFDESKHINAHINYPDFEKRKARYQRCYVLEKNPLSIYEDSLDLSAIIPLYLNKKQKISLRLSDRSGNISQLDFWLKRAPDMSPAPPVVNNYTLQAGEAHLIKYEGNILYFPDSALYEKCHLNLSVLDEIAQPLASGHVFVNTRKQVFKNPVDIYLNYNDIADSLLAKTVIVECSGKELKSMGGIVFEDFINTKIKSFGNFALYVDTIPPKITAVYFSPDMSAAKYMRFEISDNLTVGGMARSPGYKAYVDGKWILFEYDAKTKSITHYFDGRLSKGEHQLKIEVTDDRDNMIIFEKKFNL